MEYKKYISDPWFSLILLGFKNVEGRLNKNDFKNMKKNDIVVWFNDDFGFTRNIKTKIIKITNYNNFEDYLKKEKLLYTLPTIDTIEHGLMIYHKYFTQDDIKKYNVRAIKLKLLN